MRIRFKVFSEVFQKLGVNRFAIRLKRGIRAAKTVFIYFNKISIHKGQDTKIESRDQAFLNSGFFLIMKPAFESL